MTGVAIVGCGVISREYLTNLTMFADIEVLACADLDLGRAKEAADEFGVEVSGDLETVLALPTVEIVVNLTTPDAHVDVSTAALNAGKHVYSEKPLALDTASGRTLLASAHDRGLRVGCGPDTILGAGLQTCQRLIANGAIGTPQTGFASYLDAGPDAWHPRPEFLFDVGGGPLLDMGPYYLTALVQMLGPVRQVSAVRNVARPTRVVREGPRAGTPFTVGVPTYVAALLEFVDGPIAPLVVSFDAHVRAESVFEVTGDEATLVVTNPNTFTGPAFLRRYAGDSEPVALNGVTYGRGLGVADMAAAIRSGGDHRASGDLALHVLEVMTAIAEAGDCAVSLPAGAALTPRLLPQGWDPGEAR